MQGSYNLTQPKTSLKDTDRARKLDWCVCSFIKILKLKYVYKETNFYLHVSDMLKISLLLLHYSLMSSLHLEYLSIKGQNYT